MLKIDATKNQKIILAALAGILVLYLVGHFFLKTPYENYENARENNVLLNEQIEEQYREFVRLQNLKRKYLENERHLEESKSKLSIDGAELLSLLTKKSPVAKFSLSTLENDKIKVQKDGITQYPFEIKFKSEFAKIGEYLLYQESSLPISFINNIEIKCLKKDRHQLAVKFEGVIFKMN